MPAIYLYPGNQCSQACSSYCYIRRHNFHRIPKLQVQTSSEFSEYFKQISTWFQNAYAEVWKTGDDSDFVGGIDWTGSDHLRQPPLLDLDLVFQFFNFYSQLSPRARSRILTQDTQFAQLFLAAANRPLNLSLLFSYRAELLPELQKKDLLQQILCSTKGDAMTSAIVEDNYISTIDQCIPTTEKPLASAIRWLTPTNLTSFEEALACFTLPEFQRVRLFCQRIYGCQWQPTCRSQMTFLKTHIACGCPRVVAATGGIGYLQLEYTDNASYSPASRRKLIDSAPTYTEIIRPKTVEFVQKNCQSCPLQRLCSGPCPAEVISGAQEQYCAITKQLYASFPTSLKLQLQLRRISLLPEVQAKTLIPQREFFAAT